MRNPTRSGFGNGGSVDALDLALPRVLYLFLLFSTVALGATLRFSELGAPALWLDEILHVNKANQTLEEPWISWIRGLKSDHENGPLYYGFQLASRLIAEEETAARLAPALFGTLSILIIGAAGRALGGPAVGAIAALLLAVSPLHVYYSREGRPYSLVMFAVCILLWALLRRKAPISVLLAYTGCGIAALTAALATPALGSACAVAAAGWVVASRGRQQTTDGESPPSSRINRHFLVAALVGLGLVAFCYLSRTPDLASPAFGHDRPAGITLPFSPVAYQRILSSLSVSGTEWATFEPLALLFWGLAAAGLFAAFRRDVLKGLVTGGMLLLTLISTLLALEYLSRWYSIRYTSPALPAFTLLVSLGIVELSRHLSKPLHKLTSPEWAGRLSLIAAAAATALLAAPNLQSARSEPYLKVDWRQPARILERFGIDGEMIIASNGWTKTC
ncbi:MAG: glycosyltransferase family 39 protein, partial [Thermoanaerobaculia bacterium]